MNMKEEDATTFNCFIFFLDSQIIESWNYVKGITYFQLIYLISYNYTWSTTVSVQSIVMSFIPMQGRLQQ